MLAFTVQNIIAHLQSTVYSVYVLGVIEFSTSLFLKTKSNRYKKL